MIYRIVTEDKENQEELAKIVLRHFEGFSISKQIGYYKGSKENSLVIEIDTLDDDNKLGIYKLAEEIREEGKQECVLLQIIGQKSILV